MFLSHFYQIGCTLYIIDTASGTSLFAISLLSFPCPLMSRKKEKTDYRVNVRRNNIAAKPDNANFAFVNCLEPVTFSTRYNWQFRPS